MVSEVSFPRFWGVLWGGLFSGIFRFGDRKCRFRDIAICTYEGSKIVIKIFIKNCLRMLEIKSGSLTESVSQSVTRSPIEVSGDS